MRNTASERVLADLELTRGLTIQMTAIGTLGMLVGWTFFSVLYQFGTSNVVTLQFAPVSLSWLATGDSIVVSLSLSILSLSSSSTS